MIKFELSKKYFFNLILIVLNSGFIIVIFLLAIRIIDKNDDRIKGIFITNIDKKNISITNNSEKLKYFYEPIPDNTEIVSPPWLGHTVINKINSDTIHSEVKFELQKENGKYRIIILGDSLTFGYGVNTKENYSEKLQIYLDRIICKKIKNFEVINLGVGGYDVEYTVERLKNRGLKYNPDLVIYLINRWNINKRNEIYIPIIESLINKGIPYQDENTGLWVAYNQAEEIIRKQYDIDEFIILQKKKLNSINDFYSGKLLLITFPSNLPEFKEIIRDFTKKNSNFYFSDDVIDLDVEQNYLLKDRHPNNEGHDILAKNILDILKEKYLQDCR